MKFIYIYFLLFLSFSSTGQEIDRTVDEAATMFSKCAAYFSLMSIAAEKSDQNDMIKTYEQANQLMSFHALKLAGNGRIDDMASKVTLSRFEIFFKNMMNEIDHDLGNLSILINKHNIKCNEALNNPKGFAEGIVSKHDSE